MKMLSMIAVAICALALTGCGSKSCKDFCDHPCNGVTTADCQASCIKADALNSASGCKAKYDSFLSCASGLSDADRCSSNNTLCQTEGNAYAGCVIDYCTAHSSDANCH